ncbi:DnaB-like helicase C-terminal domain-containing protein [Streptomyces phaeofaciens]|uniref:DnaB-like helicase C-terminal domain-containing protein n=1 Tax=Streptomyces phaeofaciens TaxID=68254 RepID=UPI00367606C6
MKERAAGESTTGPASRCGPGTRRFSSAAAASAGHDGDPLPRPARQASQGRSGRADRGPSPAHAVRHDPAGRGPPASGNRSVPQPETAGEELQVPAIALCRLDRGPARRTRKRPWVSDVRESGSLEQDADMVILPHREDDHEKASRTPEKPTNRGKSQVPSHLVRVETPTPGRPSGRAGNRGSGRHGCTYRGAGAARGEHGDHKVVRPTRIRAPRSRYARRALGSRRISAGGLFHD